MSNDILEKGKSFPIGTIHNGFKKVAEGKWRKVSEHGMTKEEHQKETDKFLDAQLKNDTFDTRLASERSYNKWKNSNLDDKEYSDTEVMGEEKKESKVFRLKDDKDMPASLHSLKNKDLKSLGTKEVNFASGKQTYHIFDDNGKKVEVPERFLNKKSDNIQKALTTLEIGYLSGEVDEQTIISARISAEDLEKGRKANIGEIRDWKGGKYRKTAEGWEPVKDGGKPKATDQPNMSDNQEVRQTKDVSDLKAGDLASLRDGTRVRIKHKLTDTKLVVTTRKGEEKTVNLNGLIPLMKDFGKPNMSEKVQSKVFGESNKKEDTSILGYTKSGKPIIKDKDPEEYKDFTPEDHRDAAKLLRDIEHIVDLVSISNNKYNDIKKIKLEKTSKGNWRVYYDGKETGLTIGGKQIQDSVVERLGIEYKDEDIKESPEGSGDEKKEDKFPTKEDIISKLVSAGNNSEDAKKMVEEHYDYIKRVYPSSGLKKLAEVIRTIY